MTWYGPGYSGKPRTSENSDSICHGYWMFGKFRQISYDRVWAVYNYDCPLIGQQCVLVSFVKADQWVM